MNQKHADLAESEAAPPGYGKVADPTQPPRETKPETLRSYGSVVKTVNLHNITTRSRTYRP